MRAVAKSRRKTPELNGYLRAVSRNPQARVEWSGGTPHTDGTVVHLRPPIEWGDELQHERGVCNQRDPEDVLLCDACRADEFVNIVLRHEIGHMVADSFAEVADTDKLGLLRAALDEAGAADDSTRAAKVARKIATIEKQFDDAGKPLGYMGAAGMVSPFLPSLLNGLEDVRVNIFMYKARPGLYKQFRGLTTQIFRDGLEEPDGSRRKVTDASKNAQAVVGLYAKCAGYNYVDYFDPDVVECLNDPRLDKIVSEVQQARSARTIYRLCFPALEVLRSHGFCVAPDDEEEDDPPPQPTGESEDEQDRADDDAPDVRDDSESPTAADDAPDAPDDDEGDGSSPAGDTDADTSDDDDAPDDTPRLGRDDYDADADDAPDEDDADADDDAPDEDDADEGDCDADTSGDDSMPGGTPDEVDRALRMFGGHQEFQADNEDETYTEACEREADEAEIDRALIQGEHFDTPSRMVYGIQVYTEGGPGWRKNATMSELSEADESILAPALMKMRVAFSDNHKARFQRNLKSGRINARVLGRRVPVQDDRLFQKKRELGERDYFVLIGLDISGSTMGSRLDLIKAAALAQAELLHRIGINFAVYAHTGDMAKAMSNAYDVVINVVKSPEQPWDVNARGRLRALNAAKVNLDGHTLEFYRKVTERQKATDKLILYYTDGAMPNENYSDELEVLQREILHAPQRGIKIVGIGIRNSDPVQHGLDTIRIDTIEEVPKVVDGLKERIMR